MTPTRVLLPQQIVATDMDHRPKVDIRPILKSRAKWQPREGAPIFSNYTESHVMPTALLQLFGKDPVQIIRYRGPWVLCSMSCLSDSNRRSAFVEPKHSQVQFGTRSCVLSIWQKWPATRLWACYNRPKDPVDLHVVALGRGMSRPQPDEVPTFASCRGRA